MEQTKNPSGIGRTVSTLLIPLDYCLLLKAEQKRLNCNLNGYLRYLVEKYRYGLTEERYPYNRNMKTRYQGPGLNLEPRNFRPDNELWAEFDVLARGRGLSKCLLFVWLLKLELQGPRRIMRRMLKRKLRPEDVYRVTRLEHIYPRDDLYFRACYLRRRSWFVRLLRRIMPLS